MIFFTHLRKIRVGASCCSCPIGLQFKSDLFQQNCGPDFDFLFLSSLPFTVVNDQESSGTWITRAHRCTHTGKNYLYIQENWNHLHMRRRWVPAYIDRSKRVKPRAHVWGDDDLHTQKSESSRNQSVSKLVRAKYCHWAIPIFPCPS